MCSLTSCLYPMKKLLVRFAVIGAAVGAYTYAEIAYRKKRKEV